MGREEQGAQSVEIDILIVWEESVCDSFQSDGSRVCMCRGRFRVFYTDSFGLLTSAYSQALASVPGVY